MGQFPAWHRASCWGLFSQPASLVHGPVSLPGSQPTPGQQVIAEQAPALESVSTAASNCDFITLGEWIYFSAGDFGAARPAGLAQGEVIASVLGPFASLWTAQNS